MKKLAELRSEGILNDEDWERAKNIFLGKPGNKRDEAVRMLRRNTMQKAKPPGRVSTRWYERHAHVGSELNDHGLGLGVGV